MIISFNRDRWDRCELVTRHTRSTSRGPLVTSSPLTPARYTSARFEFSSLLTLLSCE